MKFGSKKAIFGAIWGGFEGFGPCLGVSHPTHSHLGEISQKKTVFFLAASLSMRRGEGERKIIIAMLIIVVMMRTMIITTQKVFGG